MASPQRKTGSSIEEQLFEKFYEFSFYRAVHLLERFSPGRKNMGRALVPGDEPVRFSVRQGLSFPASEISALKPGKENALGSNGASENNGSPHQMEVAFLGLTGPSGVLPQWYSRLVVDRKRLKDDTLEAFLNLFHHRLITLFYLAWKKYRFPENYLPGAMDRLSRYLLSLEGLGTSGLTDIIGLPEESLAFYSGMLSRPMASAVTIESAVAYFAGASVRVEQFIERVVDLEPQDRTQLGGANALLGEDTICGSQVWECQTKFRVHIGPVEKGKFVRLMPTGDLLVPVFSLVRYMVGIEFEFDLRIYLQKEDVPPCVLGQTGTNAPYLGWTTWVASPKYTYEEDIYFTFQEYDLELVKF